MMKYAFGTVVALILLFGCTAGGVKTLHEYDGKIVYYVEPGYTVADYRADCQARGWTFSECGSPCAPDAQYCVMSCAFTCENSTSTPARGELGGFCGGIAAFQCNSGLVCQLDGTFPDAGGACVKADCPEYVPPAPGWCANGTIVDGGLDSNGCRNHPQCV